MCSEKEKPPLGIEPEKIWKEKRMKEIIKTCARYYEAGYNEVNVEWLDELYRRLEEVLDY